jgi:glycosyltransferase involved in cell wall biosynthesis
MKLLILSRLYPNTAQPQQGIFVEHRVRSLLDTGRAEIRVVAPVPWFPRTRSRFANYAAFALAPSMEDRHGIRVLHPRYPVLPKIGMAVAPVLLAAALVGPLSRIIRRGDDFDIIDAYYFYPDGVAAALLGQRFGKPVVITSLGTDLNVISRYQIPCRLIRWAAGKAAGLTTVSEALKTRVRELGVASERVKVILHGVDLDLFQPPRDRADTRARLGLTGPSLLSVGHLVELKGHHLVIQALPALPGVTLLIAGSGREEQSLKRCAESLGVAQRVRFLGELDQQKLSAYYGAADALVLATSREGIPNVVLESMACGTPVITTAVGGLPEVVTAPEAGVLMVERSSAAVIRAVRALLSAPPDRRQTRRFSERFTWRRTAEQHLDLLDTILAPVGAAPLAASTTRG